MMQASFDQSSAMAPKFGAAAWKDGELVSVMSFGSEIKEPLLDRFQDLVYAVYRWLDEMEERHNESFTAFAVESFVDYQPRFKTKSLAQLNRFTGFLERALSCYRNGQNKIFPVCKGELSKDHAYAVIRPIARKWGKDITEDESDAIFHGVLAGFNRKRA